MCYSEKKKIQTKYSGATATGPLVSEEMHYDFSKKDYSESK